MTAEPYIYFTLLVQTEHCELNSKCFDKKNCKSFLLSHFAKFCSINYASDVAPLYSTFRSRALLATSHDCFRRERESTFELTITLCLTDLKFITTVFFFSGL
jgi:hypothetical protein